MLLFFFVNLASKEFSKSHEVFFNLHSIFTRHFNQ